MLKVTSGSWWQGYEYPRLKMAEHKVRWEIYDPQGRTIALVIQDPNIDPDEVDVNADMIRRLPDLLEQLNDLNQRLQKAEEERDAAFAMLGRQVFSESDTIDDVSQLALRLAIGKADQTVFDSAVALYRRWRNLPA